MVFHVVEFMEKTPSVRFPNSWLPTPKPGVGYLSQGFVSLPPDPFRSGQCLIDGRDGLCRPALRRRLPRRIQRGIDTNKAPQHQKILTIYLSNRNKNFEIVTIERNPVQIRIQKVDKFVVLYQSFLC
jgi:hypothetical protein